MNEIDINIIYEDKNIMAINKPSGLVVHNDGRGKEDSLVDWILINHPELKEVGEEMIIKGKEGKEINIKRPGIVHRLDRETSGVMVIAKDQDTFLQLKEKFQKRQIEKEYKAFVYGHIKEQSGIINSPIGRSRKDFRLKSAQRGAKGELREAITEYRVLDRFEDEKGEKYTYVSFFPKTGRTHQIRVHAKYINHPIVCDKLYAPKRKCSLGLKRLALHAFSLTIYEFNGLKNIKIEAEMPNDISSAILRYSLDK